MTKKFFTNKKYNQSPNKVCDEGKSQKLMYSNITMRQRSKCSDNKDKSK